MAVNISLYNTIKKKNSTLKPSGNSNLIAAMTGELKEPLDILNPVITIIPQSNYDPFKANYVYIPSLSRYYYINKWEFFGGRYIAYCSVDVLATYKTHIGLSTQYVERSSREHNGNIADGVYPAAPMETQIQTISNSVNMYHAGSLQDGAFVLGIVNANTDAHKYAGVQYYIMNYYAAYSFFNTLLAEPSWLEVDDVSYDFIKTLFNPCQYIQTCYWLPVPYDSFEGEETRSLDYAWWGFLLPQQNELHMKKWNGDIVTLQNDFTISHHPQYERGYYLGSSLYNSYSIYVEPYGEIEIDANLIGNKTKLNIRSDIDVPTGSSILTIDADGYYVATVAGKTGVEMNVSQLGLANNDPVSAFASRIGGKAWGLAQKVVGAFGGNLSEDSKIPFMGGMPFKSLNTVGEILAGGAQLVSTGSVGSLLAYKRAQYMFHKYRKIADENNQMLGRPLCQRRMINTLANGFILCDNADVEIPNALKPETEMIESFMNNGFFYE